MGFTSLRGEFLELGMEKTRSYYSESLTESLYSLKYGAV